MFETFEEPVSPNGGVNTRRFQAYRLNPKVESGGQVMVRNRSGYATPFWWLQ